MKRAFLGPTEVKDINSGSFKSKALGATSSQAEHKIALDCDSSPFYLLQRSATIEIDGIEHTLWHFMLCIKEANTDLPHTHFHRFFSDWSEKSKTFDGIKSKGCSDKFKVFRRVSYYLLEPSKPSNSKKRKAGGSVLQGSSSAPILGLPSSVPVLGAIGLPLSSLQPFQASAVKDLALKAMLILDDVCFSTLPIKIRVSKLKAILSDVSLDEGKAIVLPGAVGVGIFPPGAPHKDHAPPLLHWPFYPRKALCYDLNSPVPASSSAASALSASRFTIDLLTGFEQHFGPDGFIELLMEEDRFGASAFQCSGRFGDADVNSWLYGRAITIKGKTLKISATRSGFYPYHEAARHQNLSVTKACLQGLHDSLGPGLEIRDLIYGHDNKWMKRENLDQVSPNAMIKMAAVELGFMSVEEELELLFGSEKGKKVNQLAKI